jgi:hypothetical protein
LLVVVNGLWGWWAVSGDVVRLRGLGGAYLAGISLHGPPSTFLGTSQPKTNPSHPVSTGRRAECESRVVVVVKKVDNLKRQKK